MMLERNLTTQTLHTSNILNLQEFSFNFINENQPQGYMDHSICMLKQIKIEPNPILAENKSPNDLKVDKIKRLLQQNKINDLVKEDILKFLSQNLERIDLWITLRLYIYAVSFSENNLKLSMTERLKLTKLLLSNKYPISHKIEIKASNQVEIIKRFISENLSILLQRCSSASIEPARWRVQLLFELVEHVFILNVGSQYQIFSFLQKTKSCPLLNQWEQVQFILKVKHYSQWFLYRLKGNQSQKNIHVLYKHINIWCLKANQNLKQKDSTLTAEICSFLFALWRKQDQGFTHQTTKQKKQLILVTLPEGLQQQLNLQIYYIQLSKNKCRSHLKFLDQLVRITKFKALTAFYFFFFKILEIQSFQLNRWQQSSKIYTFMKSKIRSEQIMNQFIFPFMLKSLFENSDINLRDISGFLGSIERLSFQFLHTLIKLVISLTGQVKKRGHDEESQELIQIQLINFRQSLDLNEIIGQPLLKSQHQCRNWQAIMNAILIKEQISQILIIKYDKQQDVKVIKDYLNQNSCQNCFLSFRFAQLIETLNHLLYLLGLDHINSSEIRVKFEKYYEQYEKLQYKYLSRKDNVSIKRTFIQIISHYCSIFPESQEKYHGIQQLYFFLKNTENMKVYSYCTFSNENLLFQTMKMLLRTKPLEELAKFLSIISQSIDKSGTAVIYFVIFKSFTRLIHKNYHLIDFEVLYYMIERRNRDMKIEDSSCCIIYYFCLLFYIPVKLFTQLKLKIVQCIDFLPWGFRSFMKIQYIQYLLNESFYLYGVKEGMTIHERKAKWLKMKLIKLTCEKECINLSDREKDKRIKIDKLYEKTIMLSKKFTIKSSGSKGAVIRPRRI